MQPPPVRKAGNAVILRGGSEAIHAEPGPGRRSCGAARPRATSGFLEDAVGHRIAVTDREAIDWLLPPLAQVLTG